MSPICFPVLNGSFKGRPSAGPGQPWLCPTWSFWPYSWHPFSLAGYMAALLLLFGLAVHIADTSLALSGSPLLEFSFFIWILLRSGHSLTGCRPSELLTYVPQVGCPPCFPVFLKWDAHPTSPHVQASLADQVNKKSAEAQSCWEKEIISPPQGTWEVWSSEPGSRAFPFVWGWGLGGEHLVVGGGLAPDCEEGGLDH